jgi:hypothetical protein
MHTRGARVRDDIKRMDPAEFQSEGYLQEVNRRFLHPLGLALEVVRHDDGMITLGGIWDYRDDPEGISFGDDVAAKAAHIDSLWASRLPARTAALGYMVQPTNP